MLSRKSKIIWLTGIWCSGLLAGLLNYSNLSGAFIGYGIATVGIGWILALPAAFSHKFKEDKKASYYTSWTVAVLLVAAMQILSKGN